MPLSHSDVVCLAKLKERDTLQIEGLYVSWASPDGDWLPANQSLTSRTPRLP